MMWCGRSSHHIFRRIADVQDRRHFGEALGQIVSDASVGEDTLNRDADLARVVEPTFADQREDVV